MRRGNASVGRDASVGACGFELCDARMQNGGLLRQGIELRAQAVQVSALLAVSREAARRHDEE